MNFLVREGTIFRSYNKPYAMNFTDAIHSSMESNIEIMIPVNIKMSGFEIRGLAVWAGERSSKILFRSYNCRKRSQEERRLDAREESGGKA